MHLEKFQVNKIQNGRLSYISAMLVQCWASVADVGITLKQRWVSVRWSSVQSYNQVTSSTTLYCYAEGLQACEFRT